jgi:flagellar M-ring protein FliF
VNPEELVAQFKKLTATIGPKRVAMIGGALVLVIGVLIVSSYTISAPTYALLAQDLDPESASALVTKLKTAKVPYELDAGGRSIRVPQERVDELRLQFAADGLPSAGRIGFEIFDRSTFGTTDLQEHVNYQRALEGELARTIQTISEVASARVHLALAKDSLFSDQAQPAKASVVLRLKSNRPLAASTAHSIIGLVANSVESLRPESVVLLDNFGRQLSPNQDEGDDQPGSALQLDKQQQLERDLGAKVVALLEPVVGPGHVHVNVSARLKAEAEDLTEERWDPTAVVRSHQSTVESDGRSTAQGGIVGARANLATPPAANAAAPATSPVPAAAALNGPGKSTETTNYEVSRVTRHVVSPRGQLARLSVAVIVDDDHVTTKTATGVQTTNKPRAAADIQRFQHLVESAVGFDAQRGDQLTVENIAFDTPVDDTPLPPSGVQAVLQKTKDSVLDNWVTLVRTIAVVALAALALFGVVAPIARRALALPARPLPLAAGEHVQTIEEMERQVIAGGEPGHVRRPPSLTHQVARLANEEPEQLAKIVRGWLAED